ncbi:MAG TPA: hypothetical protein VGF07_08470 [Stellaceae bacterium]
MVRIEALLTAMQADMGSLKADIASMKAEMASMKAEAATKPELSDIAKNIEVKMLGRQMRELLAVKDDLRVVTAIFQRLDNAMARQARDVADMRADHSRMDRLLDRGNGLEAAPPEER